MAPEVISKDGGGYGKEVDLWSVGAMLYQFLGGEPLFWGTAVAQIYTVLLDSAEMDRAELFKAPVWATVPEEAKDLVAGLLTKDPSKRLTVDQAFANPWLRSATNAPSGMPADELVHRLASYATASDLRKLASLILVRSMIPEEKKGLVKLFRSIDKGSGVCVDCARASGWVVAISWSPPRPHLGVCLFCFVTLPRVFWFPTPAWLISKGSIAVPELAEALARHGEAGPNRLMEVLPSFQDASPGSPRGAGDQATSAPSLSEEAGWLPSPHSSVHASQRGSLRGSIFGGAASCIPPSPHHAEVSAVVYPPPLAQEPSQPAVVDPGFAGVATELESSSTRSVSGAAPASAAHADQGACPPPVHGSSVAALSVPGGSHLPLSPRVAAADDPELVFLAKTLFLRIDLSGDAKITEDEFVAAAMPEQKLSDKAHLLTVFQFLDKRGVGRVTEADLMAALDE